MKKLLSFLFCFCFYIVCSAGDPLSSFSKITSDINITATSPTAIITKTFTLLTEQKVLVVADGRYFPSTGVGMAQVNIQIDGSDSYSNNSIIDWRNTQHPAQHSFDCLASATLSVGTHTIRLVALVRPETPGTAFKIGSYSGLSILINPAPNMISSELPSDSVEINHLTNGIDSYTAPPMTTLLSHTIDVGTEEKKVITLCSGRAYKSIPGALNQNEGDALWGIYLNNETCTNNQNALWSVNDLFYKAELHAPMFTHALHTISGINTIRFKAGELTFADHENDIKYKVGAKTRLVTLYGMNFSGQLICPNTSISCDREDWSFFGTNVGWPNIPVSGTKVEMASFKITIPETHNGVVLFLAKARIQPDKDDAGGQIYFTINIDGSDVGTLGVQEIKQGAGDSSRTMSASYLSAGSDALSTGKHIVKVYIQAVTTGSESFKHIAYAKNIPLIYLD